MSFRFAAAQRFLVSATAALFVAAVAVGAAVPVVPVA
jgi:hypothetical protein